MKIELNHRSYVWYKLLNSLFFGLSTGSIFIIYTPLKPSVYSLGGIFLAIGLLVIAKFYEKMMNKRVFYLVTFFVEAVVLALVMLFLLFSYSYMTALLVYVSYQLTFMFGGYLVRVETLMLQKATMLKLVDVSKQKGYLIGMVIAYLFYETLEHYGVAEKQTQVYFLHFILLVLQCSVLLSVYKAFNTKN